MTSKIKNIELIITSIAAIITLIVIFYIQSQQKESAYIKAANDVLIELPPAHRRANSTAAKKSTEISTTWQTVTIKSGDTLKSIFVKHHIPKHELWALIKLHNRKLTLLIPGHKLNFLMDRHYQLEALRIPLGADQAIEFTKVQNHFTQKVIHFPMVAKLSFKSGIVNHSLLASMGQAGISNKLSHQLVNIFQSKINFKRDVHPGDRFSILYKDYYINGRKHHSGDIVTAEYTTRNHTYQAIRFSYPKDHADYYTPEGKSLAHRFLPYPVHFKRISSHFSHNRMDPILHRRQAHLGIDFAAYKGTPIKSIGNGRITFIGHDHGYGNAIKVRYDRHYSALYGHMEYFAKNLKLHQYIHRGQTIGFVGSTGWSTGPHLHFSFDFNGIPEDWLTLKPPSNPPIPRKYHYQFIKIKQTLLAALELYQATALAANTTNPFIIGTK